MIYSSEQAWRELVDLLYLWSFATNSLSQLLRPQLFSCSCSPDIHSRTPFSASLVSLLLVPDLFVILSFLPGSKLYNLVVQQGPFLFSFSSVSSGYRLTSSFHLCVSHNSIKLLFFHNTWIQKRLFFPGCVLRDTSEQCAPLRTISAQPVSEL